MSEIVENDHLVFRMVIHPLAFPGKSFEKEKMMNLSPETSTSLVTSLAWTRYLANEQALHDFGCRLASGMNQRILSDKGKLKPSSRRAYCGSYELTAKSIRALTAAGLDEVVGADVVHEVEHGEIAHVNLRITLRPDSKFSVASTMTAIVDRLWHSCRGPLRYACDCDTDLSPHPSVTLPAAPISETLFNSDKSAKGSDSTSQLRDEQRQ